MLLDQVFGQGSDGKSSKHRNASGGPGRTLKLLYPQDDLGFVYGAKVATRSLTSDLQQKLVVGGRLPHAELTLHASNADTETTKASKASSLAGTTTHDRLFASTPPGVLVPTLHAFVFVPRATSAETCASAINNLDQALSMVSDPTATAEDDLFMATPPRTAVTLIFQDADNALEVQESVGVRDDVVLASDTHGTWGRTLNFDPAQGCNLTICRPDGHIGGDVCLGPLLDTDTDTDSANSVAKRIAQQYRSCFFYGHPQ